MTAWPDKVVLVTGSSTGFGSVLARRLVQRGAKVILTARDPDRLAATVHALESLGGHASGFAADVTRADDVARLMAHILERHPRLDMLVNNVGVSDRGMAADTLPDRFRELWEANFLSAVYCTQAALPQLVRSRGHLVFMASLAAKIGGRYLGAYPASKFPLAGFAQQLRLELGPEGPHVLLVCPGPITRHDSGRRYEEQARNLPEAANQPGGGVRLKGIDPEQLADAILRACEQRRPELIVPAKARWLFAISQLWPTLGDWIIRRQMS